MYPNNKRTPKRKAIFPPTPVQLPQSTTQEVDSTIRPDRSTIPEEEEKVPDTHSTEVKPVSKDRATVPAISYPDTELGKELDVNPAPKTKSKKRRDREKRSKAAKKEKVASEAAALKDQV
jgi:hypothetical protein